MQIIEFIRTHLDVIVQIQLVLAALSGLFQVLGQPAISKVLGTIAVLDVGRIVRKLPPKSGPGVGTGTAILLVVSALFSQGCSILRSQSFWDGIQQTCEIALTARPEVADEAKRRQIAVGELASALCRISDLIEPFVVEKETGALKAAAWTPADEAVVRAKQKGLIQ